MELINLVPHDVVVEDPNNPDEFVTFPASGTIARAVEIAHDMPEVNGLRCRRISYSRATDLPDWEPGKGYIVSFITILAAAISGRRYDDLFYPGDYIRDDKGEIKASRYLYQWWG